MKVADFELDNLLNNHNNNPENLTEDEREDIRKRLDRLAERYAFTNDGEEEVIIPLSTFLRRFKEPELIYAKEYADSKRYLLRTTDKNIEGVVIRRSSTMPLYKRKETAPLSKDEQQEVLNRLVEYRKKIAKEEITDEELEEYKNLRKYFIEHNIRLATTAAMKHHSNLSEEEKEEFALEFLVYAVDGYINKLAEGKNLNITLSTFVTNIIRWKWAMMEASEQLIRISYHKLTKINTINQLLSHLNYTEYDDFDLERVSSLTGMDIEEVKKLLSSNPQMESVEEHQESDETFLDRYNPPRYLDDTEYFALEHINQETIAADLELAMKDVGLTKIDIKLFYDLFGSENPMTLRELGRKYHTSHETVRTCRNKVLSKVREQPILKKYQ